MVNMAIHRMVQYMIRCDHGENDNNPMGYDDDCHIMYGIRDDGHPYGFSDRKLIIEDAKRDGWKVNISKNYVKCPNCIVD